ncbi:hypothetical protein BDP27DRAFT_1230754 [Rhodocollybia butyracea]|uniref:Integral membrane protein n=1 Tax=Rhodocollybia butyracea TaxID=206335 RepID=A0A9P5PJC2_9AGAR|nr:hypothetical protein BDP27DRAFT_1230754 [Rhodocollybia butyracea]
MKSSSVSSPNVENTEEVRWHHVLDPSLIAHSHINPLSSSFLHPTQATLARKDPNSNEEFLWTSRNQRKNRHIKYTPNTKSRHGSSLLVGLGHMVRIEYWNVSWWLTLNVIQAFTLGSVVWVINGFYSFLPFVDSSFANSVSGIGWSAWVGATIFEFGAILGVLEAWNRGDTANFGWGVSRALGYKDDNDTEAQGNTEFDRDAPGSSNNSVQAKTKLVRKRKWMWYSTDPKYWHELGFLAAFVQFWAATIFWISGFTALPEIQNTISTETGVQDGTFWTPQVVGGTGFIISSTLLILETQKKWYIPNLLSLGWQIAIWNFIGAVGFTLCGALGYASATSTKAAYQSSLCTFWGGWAFLIGSVLQWYEAVNSV